MQQHRCDCCLVRGTAGMPMQSSSHRYSPSLPVAAIGAFIRSAVREGEGLNISFSFMWMEREFSSCLHHHWFEEAKEYDG